MQDRATGGRGDGGINVVTHVGWIAPELIPDT